MFSVPRKPTSVRKQSADRLMQELGRVEMDLQHWISRSETNARLFREDPIAAMRSAGLDMEDELICELERLMQDIARKLK